MSTILGKNLLMRRSRRVSVIPYILSPNSDNVLELWFLFGVYNSTPPITIISKKLSTQSSTIEPSIIKPSFYKPNNKNITEITDIGGGIKKDENDLIAALRELNEETRNIFKQNINIEKLSNCLATIQHEKPNKNKKTITKLNEGGDGGRSAIFVPLNKEWLINTSSLFEEAGKTAIESEEHELSSLIWLNESSFLQLLNVNSTIKKDDEQYSLWSNLIYFYKEIYTAELRSKLYANWIKEYYVIETKNNDKETNNCLPKFFITHNIKKLQSVYV